MYKRIAGINDLDSLRDVQDELIDRYGDIPKPVQTLLDISLLKSEAESIGLTSVTVKQEEASLVFDPEAQISPERFFDTVRTLAGAQVMTKAVKSGGREKNATVLRIRLRKKSPEDMFTVARDAVQVLKKCVEN